MYKLFRRTLRWFVPVGVLETLAGIRRTKSLSEAVERRALSYDRAVSDLASSSDVSYSYQDSVSYLIKRGLPDHHVREGSMPYESLQYSTHNISLPEKDVYNVLHVGNFVGVSLAFYADWITGMSSKSIVVSIDPNIQHRGIDNPQKWVIRLLERYKLDNRVIMITGFSDSRNPINDGEEAYLTDSTILSDEFAPVGVLNTLIDLNVQSKFDCAIMDGNHNAEYLVRELELLKPLLADLAFVVLDDVDEHWPSIQTVYNTSRNFGFTPKACDGRVGILEYHRPG